MTEATRKLNQLEAGVERVKDPVVREALVGLIEYVQSIAGSGVSTHGNVSARDGFAVGSAAKIDRNGNLSAKTLQTDSGGEIKFIVYKGILAAGASIDLPTPKGVCYGWSGVTEVATEGSDLYFPIVYDASATEQIIGVYTDDGGYLELGNVSATEDYKYRVVIFYRENA